MLGIVFIGRRKTEVLFVDITGKTSGGRNFHLRRVWQKHRTACNVHPQMDVSCEKDECYARAQCYFTTEKYIVIEIVKHKLYCDCAPMNQ